MRATSIALMCWKNTHRKIGHSINLHPVEHDAFGIDQRELTLVLPKRGGLALNDVDHKAVRQPAGHPRILYPAIGKQAAAYLGHVDQRLRRLVGPGIGVRNDLDLAEVETGLPGHVRRRLVQDAERHRGGGVRVHDAMHLGTDRENARMPTVLFRRLPGTAAHLRPVEIHLDDVLDGGVAKGDAGRGAQIPRGVRDADADVAARARGEPALAGTMTDVDQMLLQIIEVHARSVMGR